MKISLVPTHQINRNSVPIYMSSGILLLNSILVEHSFNSEVIDLVEFGEIFDRNENEVISGVCTKILLNKPDIIGFSVMQSILPFVILVSQELKKINPELIIIFGGSGISHGAKELLNICSEADIILRGECDKSIVQLMQALEINKDISVLPEIPGLVFRKNANIIDHGWPEPLSDLDELPLINYKLINTQYDYNFKWNEVTLELGRGCPYNCVYCTTAGFFNKQYRLKSIDRAVEEFRNVIENVENAKIFISQDIFTLKKSYVFELCNKLIENFENIEWTCFTRINIYDPELYSVMYQAGCREIHCGIESFSKKVLKYVKKGTSLRHSDDYVKCLTDLDYNKIGFSFIVGVPEVEDKSDIEITLNKILSYKAFNRNVDSSILILTAFMGSELYNQWSDKLIYDNYNKAGFSTLPLTWGKIRDLIRSDSKLFSPYYYINGTNIEQSVKYALIGQIISFELQYSTVLAYLSIGENFVKYLLNNLSRVQLPDPQLIDQERIETTIDSFIDLIEELMIEHPNYKFFKTLALFEKSYFNLKLEIKSKKESLSKLMKFEFDPLYLCELIDNKIENSNSFDNISNIYEGNLDVLILFFSSEKDQSINYQYIAQKAVKKV